MTEDRFFQLIETEVTILNLTSSTAFKSNPKTRLCTIDDETVVCEVPFRQCAEHHALLVSIWVRNPETGQKKEITFTARVEKIQGLMNGREKITFSLVQYEQKEWTQFQEIFSKRQKTIDRFVEVTRGIPVRMGESLIRKQREAEALRQFFGEKHVLLVDPADAVLAELERMMIGMGALKSRIHQARSVMQAEDIINKFKPAVIVTEYQLGRSSSLELLAKAKSEKPIFIILSENSSQAAVARSVQEDIDAFVIKPFQPENLRRALAKAAMERLNPPNYLAEIRQGEVRLGRGELEWAEKHFTQALEMDAKPALACYHLGEVKMMRSDLAAAEKCFKQGLEYNRLHFKCMDGRYRVAMKEQRLQEAYDLADKISRYFPVGGPRLAEMMKLAVVNGRYDDVERLFKIFCRLTERDRSLVNHVCAGLVVCGKHYLRTQNRSRALEVLEKAAVTGFERVRILMGVVQALIDHHLINEAKHYLGRFPYEQRGTKEFLELDFQVQLLAGDQRKVIAYGHELIRAGKASERVFELMVERLTEIQDLHGARAVFEEGAKRYPEAKTQLEHQMMVAAA